jgi:hypothetical protein
LLDGEVVRRDAAQLEIRARAGEGWQQRGAPGCHRDVLVVGAQRNVLDEVGAHVARQAAPRWRERQQTQSRRAQDALGCVPCSNR